MKRRSDGFTPKQYAYAVKKLGGEGRSKKDMALSVGYTPSIAANAYSRIEKTKGYQNAVLALASESGNLAMAVMAEYKSRGLKNFSNKDLNSAMNAITQAWSRFDTKKAPNGTFQPENPIKKAIFQRIENQTINVTAKAVPPKAEGEYDPTIEDDDLGMPDEVEDLDLDF